jgi:hypothetical protein
MAVPRPGRVRDALRSLVATRTEFEASQERREAALTGCTAVADLTNRRRAEVAGVLRSVTLRARQNVPALEAELYDGSGSLRVVWLGQRRIAGIEPGRRARLEGMVCMSDGTPTMYNPRYELVATRDR